MKKKAITILTIALMTGLLAGCGSGKESQQAAERPDSLVNEDSPIAMCNVEQGGKTYNVADINDSMQVYTQDVKREQCFIVISKREFRLYVYEARPQQQDTILAAHFPVCYARHPEAKTKSGDMRIRQADCADTRLKTISGDIGWRGSCRELSVNTISGDIHAVGSFLRTKVQTVSGDLEIL